MKKTLFSNLFFVALAAGILTSCGGDSKVPPAEQTGNTNTEDMVQGVDGGLDSLNNSSDTSSSGGESGGGTGEASSTTH